MKIGIFQDVHANLPAFKKAMETSEDDYLSFITSSGDLHEIEVKNDVIRIESLYKNNGFIDNVFCRN